MRAPLSVCAARAVGSSRPSCSVLVLRPPCPSPPHETGEKPAPRPSLSAAPRPRTEPRGRAARGGQDSRPGNPQIVMPLGRWEPSSAHPRSRPPLRLSPRRLGAHLARCQPAATPTRFCGAWASFPSFLALRHLSVLVAPRPPAPDTHREGHSPQWLGFRWASPCAPGPPLRMPPAAGGSASPVLQGFPSRLWRGGGGAGASWVSPRPPPLACRPSHPPSPGGSSRPLQQPSPPPLPARLLRSATPAPTSVLLPSPPGDPGPLLSP